VTDDSRFCPNCGSENVEPDFRRTNVLGEMIFNQNKWLCNECGYTGIVPSGEPEEDTEFEPEEQEKVDGDAGSAYFKYLFYVLVPATVLFITAVLLRF
jgi:ribosomal protein S27AE